VSAACGTESGPGWDGEDLDVATVVLAADSPPSVLPITAVVAGFVLISHHSS
jgi:hypothetical protein